MVAKKLLEEIIPRFGLPVSIGSDNGPAFVSKIVQDWPQPWGPNGSYIASTVPRAQDK